MTDNIWDKPDTAWDEVTKALNHAKKALSLVKGDEEFYWEKIELLYRIDRLERLKFEVVWSTKDKCGVVRGDKEQADD